MTNLNERKEVVRRLRNNADESPEWIIPWAVFNDAQEHDNIPHGTNPLEMKYCPNCGARVANRND